jgi:hypothetical protein
MAGQSKRRSRSFDLKHHLHEVELHALNTRSMIVDRAARA